MGEIWVDVGGRKNAFLVELTRAISKNRKKLAGRLKYATSGKDESGLSSS
jgi:hypothetical protein